MAAAGAQRARAAAEKAAVDAEAAAHRVRKQETSKREEAEAAAKAAADAAAESAQRAADAQAARRRAQELAQRKAAAAHEERCRAAAAKDEVTRQEAARLAKLRAAAGARKREQAAVAARKAAVSGQGTASKVVVRTGGRCARAVTSTERLHLPHERPRAQNQDDAHCGSLKNKGGGSSIWNSGTRPDVEMSAFLGEAGGTLVDVGVPERYAPARFSGCAI